MNVGLEIFNASGVLLLDGTHRIGRLKGSVYLPGSGDPGSVASDLSDGAPFTCFFPEFLFRHINQNTPIPIITVTSQGISWAYSSTGGNSFRYPTSGWIFWGVY